MHYAQSLPYASSLCGACYEVCPVKINIPEVLIHLRNKVVKQNTAGVVGFFDVEATAMKAMAAIFRSERRFRAAQRLGRAAEYPLARKDGWIGWLPGMLGGWTQVRDLQEMPKETFRDWVGEAREEWQLRWLQIRRGWRFYGGSERLRVAWRVRKLHGLDGIRLRESTNERLRGHER